MHTDAVSASAKREKRVSDLFNECEQLGFDFGPNRAAVKAAAEVQEKIGELTAQHYRAEEAGESTALLSIMLDAARAKLRSILDTMK